MALTRSEMLPLATKAPEFNLVDTVSGKTLSLDALQSDIATVIMFICNHCPYVAHIQKSLVNLAKEYQTKGIQFIAISANDPVSHPDDAPDKMKAVAEREGYSFPYLFDESQEIAKTYHAVCTPDFYIFDGDLLCVYRGRFDDSSPRNNIAVTGNDVRNALDNILAKKPVNPEQKPSMGCNIKWK